MLPGEKKASPKWQNNLSVSVLGQSEPSCCHSGSQQPKAQQTPHLPVLQWAEGGGPVQPEPIFTIAAALPSARERVSRCVWPLRMPVMLLTLSYHLWTCTKSHTNSVTVCVTGLTSRTEMLWRHCLHQFDLDTPFIQAKVKSKVTGPWYCIMMTTTTSLSMETEVQEKNQDILSIFYFLLWKNQFPAPMFR